MANEIEKQTLNFFVMGTREFLGAFNIKDLNPGRLIIAIFFYFVGFLFVGNEAIKIIFRKKFSKGNIDFTSIIIATIAFWTWSLVCFNKMNETLDSVQHLELLSAVLFNGTLGILVLVKGLYDWNKPESEGDTGTRIGKTILFGFFKDTFMTENRIMMILEPIIILSLASYLADVNYYLGAPLIFCAISRIIVNILDAKRTVEERNNEATNSNNSQNSRNVVE